MQAGHAINNSGIAVSFPSDGAQASQLARINAALVTLQNLNGPGVGCPASSTTFVAQQAAIQAGTAPPAPAAAPATPVAAAPASPPAAAPAPPPSPESAAPADTLDREVGGVPENLIPPFEHKGGINPNHGAFDPDLILCASAGAYISVCRRLRWYRPQRPQDPLLVPSQPREVRRCAFASLCLCLSIHITNLRIPTVGRESQRRSGPRNPQPQHRRLFPYRQLQGVEAGAYQCGAGNSPRLEWAG